MRISDWSSDVCSSDLVCRAVWQRRLRRKRAARKMGARRQDPRHLRGHTADSVADHCAASARQELGRAEVSSRFATFITGSAMQQEFYERVRVTIDDDIAQVTLIRAERHNGMDFPMLKAMLAAQKLLRRRRDEIGRASCRERGCHDG